MERYLVRRNSEIILQYGLLRRTGAIIQQFQQLGLPKSTIVLDIGTADGLVLHGFMEYYGLNRCIGMDIRFGYLKAAKENVPYVIQADGRRLPFCENSIEVIVSTATFKHVRGLENLLEECHRVLKPGGKLAVIDPTPFGIHLGMLLGYFARKTIVQILSLKDTQQMLIRNGFTVIYAERFMLSPIPFFSCDVLERALKRMHFDQLFFMQIIFAERSTC